MSAEDPIPEATLIYRHGENKAGAIGIVALSKKREPDAYTVIVQGEYCDPYLLTIRIPNEEDPPTGVDREKYPFDRLFVRGDDGELRRLTDDRSVRAIRRQLDLPPASREVFRRLKGRREQEHVEKEIELLKTIYGEDYPAKEHLEKLRSGSP